MSIGPRISFLEEDICCTGIPIDERRIQGNHHQRQHLQDQTKMDVQDEYNITIDTIKSLHPSSSIKISIINQLDPEITKEILFRHPDIFTNPAENCPHFPLPPFEITYNKKNLRSDENSTSSDGTDVSHITIKKDTSEVSTEEKHETLESIRGISVCRNGPSQRFKQKQGHTLFTQCVGGGMFNYAHKRYFQKAPTNNDMIIGETQFDRLSRKSIESQNIEALMDMGFGAEDSVEALKRTNIRCKCKVQAASKYILGINDTVEAIDIGNSQIKKPLQDKDKANEREDEMSRL